MQSSIRHSISRKLQGKELLLSGSSNWTPQKLGSKVLGWFREIDEVGGHQPNKVVGASDYLTVVSGSGLNKVYTLPNTTPYKNADTDNCWWKTDASLSVTDGNRLIGYDFARTIVKYDSVSPYTLREIIILSEALTDAEKLSITKYMKLNPWWTNEWIEGGEIKENRAFEYTAWTPESILPSALTDNNGTSWLDYMVGVTKTGANITAITDRFGVHNFSATGNPTWDIDSGIYFNASVKYICTDLFASQAINSLYMVIKPVSWANPRWLFDGGSDGEVCMLQNGVTPQIKGGTSAGWSALLNLSLNNWHIVRLRVKHTASQIKIDSDTEVNFSCAGPSMTRTLIGTRYNAGYPANMYVKEFIHRKVYDSDANADAICNYLKSKYSL